MSRVEGVQAVGDDLDCAFFLVSVQEVPHVADKKYQFVVKPRTAFSCVFIQKLRHYDVPCLNRIIQLIDLDLKYNLLQRSEQLGVIKNVGELLIH